MPHAQSLPPAGAWRPWHIIQTMLDPDAALLRLVRDVGDPFTDRTLPTPMVFSCTPEGARQLLTADPDLFAVPDPDLLAPFLGIHSLLLLVGDRHRAERKLLNPHFHGDRMRAYGDVVAEIAEAQAASWRLGERFTVLDATQAISLEVILRAVFGVGSDRIDAFRRAVLQFVGTLTPPLFFFRWLRRDLGGRGPWSDFLRARAQLDAMLDAEIARRRQGDLVGQHDILSLLLQARYEDGGAMSPAQLRDELVTLLFAGHETTAIALAWALYFLHRHPETLQKLLAELATLGPRPSHEAVATLPYLSAVCNETLRLHPVVPILPPRQLRRPFHFQGYDLPPDLLVSIGTMRLHKREDLYPDPYRFHPDRFVGRSYSAFEYMPFGGGVRRCIGASFALYEMKIVLATILPRHRLILQTHGPVRAQRRNAVMGPSRDLRMALIQRDSPPSA